MAMRGQAVQRTFGASHHLADSPRWLMPILVLAGCLAGATAAIPERAQKDPRYALGYVVVTRCPGVSSDGTGGSTGGIQTEMRRRGK
jgi:hypothetical protein